MIEEKFYKNNVGQMLEVYIVKVKSTVIIYMMQLELKSMVAVDLSLTLRKICLRLSKRICRALSKIKIL